MSRHKSRHRAVQVLYQCDLRGISSDEAVRNYYEGLYTEESDEKPARDSFMEELVSGTLGRRTKIDEAIERHADRWRLGRIAAVDRNILRLAAFELMQNRLPAPIVIDEALELVRRFSGAESVAFMNGVLDAIRKELSTSASHSPAGE